jgi:hypothetical protein
MPQLSLSPRAGIAITRTVAAFINADVGIVGRTTQNIAGRGANHGAKAGTDNRTSGTATSNGITHNGPAQAADDGALLGGRTGRQGQARCGDDQKLMHEKPSKTVEGKNALPADWFQGKLAKIITS